MTILVLMLMLIMLTLVKIISDFDNSKEGIKTLAYGLAMLVTDFLVLCTQY